MCVPAVLKCLVKSAWDTVMGSHLLHMRGDTATKDKRHESWSTHHCSIAPVVQLSIQMHAISRETASTLHCTRTPDLKKIPLPSTGTGIGSFILSCFEKWVFFSFKRLNYFDRDLTAKDQLPQRSGSRLSLGVSGEHLGS